MGSKINPGKFDCYGKAEPDEPTFTLLGRDPSAGALVRLWALTRYTQIGEGKFPFEHLAKVAEAMQCAKDMDEACRRAARTPVSLPVLPEPLLVIFEQHLKDIGHPGPEAPAPSKPDLPVAPESMSRLSREVSQTACVFEVRNEDGTLPTSGGFGRCAWCRTHGFDCPHLSNLSQGASHAD